MQDPISFLFTVYRNNYLIVSLTLPVKSQSFPPKKLIGATADFGNLFCLIFRRAPNK